VALLPKDLTSIMYLYNRQVLVGGLVSCFDGDCLLLRDFGPCWVIFINVCGV
jgi:hypothetical protein